MKSRRANGVILSPRTREDEMRYPSSSRQVGRKVDESILPLPFYSIQTLNGFDDAHSLGPSTSLSPLIQMLILSRNTPTDTLEIMCIPEAHGTVKLT